MKIYSYANPFTLSEEYYWNEIKSVPNFCVSQTLVQGLSRHYGRYSFQYLCTIDRVINALYHDWYQSVETKIKQYISISRQIEQIPDKKLAKSLKFNQQDLVDAARFIITLGVKAKDFFTTNLSIEQKAFLSILKNIEDEPCWKFISFPDGFSEQLVNAIKKVFILEVEEAISEIINENRLSIPINAELSDKLYVCLEYYSKKQDDASVRQRKKLEHYAALSINPQWNNIKKVVLHGIHQFTPKILSVINAMEKSGIEVIFLINYHAKYGHMYETWDKVYTWTKCAIPKDLRSDNFECRLIGECIGNILEGRRSGDVRLESSIYRYKNKTAFADHVASQFAEASLRSKNPSSTLSHMKEQFYGVQSEKINEILKFYFPEHFGDRHFLSYPIGQFILSLYNMWNEDKGFIVTDDQLRECLTLNIWGFHGTTTPISVYEKIKDYISDLTEIGSIIERLELLRYNKKIIDKETNPVFEQFSFYSVPDYDISYFINILKDIKRIADELFSKAQGQQIDFREHFTKLIRLISMKMSGNKYVTEQERYLVDEVQKRLSSLDKANPIVGSIEDLKNTIHYYLNNESDDQSAHWIVRNFEQIDGGVLLSPHTQAKTYHLALLSDRNMKQANEKFFPWPLSAAMLESQSNISDQCKTILTSYQEYRNFLRYCFFYGTFYLESTKKIQFSFVEENESEIDIPYYILTLLGLEVREPDEDVNNSTLKIKSNILNVNQNELNKAIAMLEDRERDVFVSCPYRFVLSHILEEKSCFTESFDNRRLFSLLLFNEIWIKNVGIPYEEIHNKMLIESERFKPYFPFWKTVDFIDMENLAYFYLTNNMMIRNNRLKDYDPNYVLRKLIFKDARFKICKPREYSEVHLRAYLKSNISKEPIKAPQGESLILCKSCNERNVCMRPYLQEEF